MMCYSGKFLKPATLELQAQWVLSSLLKVLMGQLALLNLQTKNIQVLAKFLKNLDETQIVTT